MNVSIRPVLWMIGACVVHACGPTSGMDDAAASLDGAVTVDSTMPVVDAAVDAATPDTRADAAVADAGMDAAGQDAGGPDAGTDAAGADGGPIDTDGDGVREPYDCDDSDSAVRTESTRPCSSACGTGIETCLRGTWNACNAPTDCVCITDGMTRNVTCGLCGTRRQSCTGGAWADSGACTNAGSCVPGDTQTRDTGYCVSETRACSTSCAWSAYSDDGTRGECAAGYMEVCVYPFQRRRLCSVDCMWGPPDPTCN